MKDPRKKHIILGIGRGKIQEKGDHMKIQSKEEMKKWTLEFFRTLPSGAVVSLEGDLGAGKTQMVQWIGQALGVQKPIPSPTFDLVHTYKTPRGPLRHLDLYRLETPREIEALDYEDYFYPENGYTFIEWAKKAGPYLPKDLITLTILKGPGEEREVFLS